MQSELKLFFSLDIDCPLSEFSPAEEDNFGFWARMIVGIRGQDGGESFDVFICTPKWLAIRSTNNEVVFGQYHLIVGEYDYNKIYQALRQKTVLVANSWDEIAAKICKVAYWEFEDYLDSPRY